MFATSLLRRATCAASPLSACARVALLALTFVVGSRSRAAALDQSAGAVAASRRKFVKADLAISPPAIRRAEGASRFPGNAIAIVLFLGLVANAGQTAGSRHGGGRRRGVVRAILYGRTAPLLGGGRHDRRARRVCRRLSVAAACDEPGEPLSRSGGGDSYQVNRSMESFANGGLWAATGEGTVKGFHAGRAADFVFAVAGEEFGLIVCVAIVGIFRLYRAARLPRLLRSQPVRGCCRDRPSGSVRVAGGHQHGITLHLIPTRA